MPASLAELVYPDGSPSLYCPSSGRLICSNEEGFDPHAAHSPHLRFVVDWIGQIFAVRPEMLPEDQQAYQQQLLKLLSDGSTRFSNHNEMIAACLKVMPASCLVFEVLDPPSGSSDSEIAYFGFDLAPTLLQRAQLEEVVIEEYDDD
jgi:hypothetical protein